MPPTTPPIIGITPDVGVTAKGTPRYKCAAAYAVAVARAGGVPVILPHQIEHVERYAAMCHGFVFTGGDDPATEAFGEATHPAAKVMDAGRQAFELALLAAVDHLQPQAAVLGVCLGMQLMALHRGGRLHQHLPDVLGDAAEVHAGNRRHAVTFDDGRTGEVVSSHHQAVADAGSLRTIARAADGVIEAIDDPARHFYLGVQWHPERGGDPALSTSIFTHMMAASASATAR
jgi:putative glutamine amidotransferase